MRDALIILAVCLVAVGAGSWLFLAGGTGTDGGTSAEVSFRTLDRGDHSGEVTLRVNYRIKDVDEFGELWSSIHGLDSVPPPVNFEENDVLAVFDGTHATGGYSIRVTAVTDITGLNRQVAITHEEPGASCVVTDAFTSPYELIVVPKSPAALSREDTTLVVECS
jgi:hypothetical protein